ncbi:MAG: YHS domain-containing protein [Chthonomonadales bacterium]
MKSTLFVLAAIAISATAFAKVGDKTPKSIKCAVMAGKPVDVKEATSKKMFADYKGNRYFFCCAGCPEAFKKDPAKFAKAPHIKTPATKKG